MVLPDANRIAALNDRARQTFADCRVCITPGLQALGDEMLHTILLAVQKFNKFTPDNDPYEEHDFGKIEVGEHMIFWKFDYYDLDLSMHSPDPSDPTVTARVLTVLLADEY
jgi:hypothetical protein